MESKIYLTANTILELRKFAYLNSGGDLEAAEKIYQFLIGGCKETRLLKKYEVEKYNNRNLCEVDLRSEEEKAARKEISAF